MRRPVLIAASALTVALLLTPALSADAAAKFTRTRLDSSFQTDTLKTRCNAVVSASEQVVASRYTVEVFNSYGASVGQCGVISNIAITPAGTRIVGTLLLPSGSYSYAPFVAVAGAQPVQVGAFEPLSVSNGSAATPAPPTVTPSPSSSPTASPTPSATPTATPTASIPTGAPTSGEILFSDDFSGAADAAYDHSKWGEWSTTTYNSSAGYGNIKPGDRAALDGAGHLSIPATPTVGTSIATGSKFRFTYGTITARMMVPTQKGYWPAFWTLNNNPSGKPNSATVGEVDVLEAYTQYSDGYRRATHNYTPQGTWSSSDNPLCGGGDIRGQWHDYSAKVEPGQVTFYFDGRQCGPVEKSTDPEAGGKPYAIDAAANWLLLTNAVDTTSGAPAPTANSALLVDSVKVAAN